MNDDLSVKKKIMYIKDEDYNYLTYNILIILEQFKCVSRKQIFAGYLKLSFLINFLSSDEDTELFIEAINMGNYQKQIDLEFYNQLLKIYTKSKFLQGHIKRLLFALKQKNIIDILPDKFSSVGIYMCDNKQRVEVLQSDIFKEEKNRIERIKDILNPIGETVN